MISATQLVCQHMDFRASVGVTRLSEVEGGPVTGFSADVAIRCAHCDLAFRFLGVKFGASPHEPRVSADALELRAPLEPAITPEILGRPQTSGRA